MLGFQRPNTPQSDWAAGLGLKQEMQLLIVSFFVRLVKNSGQVGLPAPVQASRAVEW
jgi:hypothetical protein